MRVHYNCRCADSGKCSYVENFFAIVNQMEKEGKDFSFVHLYVDVGSDICRSMQQGSENRLEITCGFLKEYLPKDEDMRKELDYIHDFFWNKTIVYEDCDGEEVESEGSSDDDYDYLSPKERLEKIKRKIREASGKDFVVEVVESIYGDKKQARAELDGKTVKVCKKMIEDLDEDELAGVIAHEVAHVKYPFFKQIVSLRFPG